jgi:hypothetical protein
MDYTEAKLSKIVDNIEGIYMTDARDIDKTFHIYRRSDEPSGIRAGAHNNVFMRANSRTTRKDILDFANRA